MAKNKRNFFWQISVFFVSTLQVQINLLQLVCKLFNKQPNKVLMVIYHYDNKFHSLGQT